jgi:maltodextrin utilization protein YvdJ
LPYQAQFCSTLYRKTLFQGYFLVALKARMQEVILKFPATYFSTIWTPKQCLKGRNRLKIWQVIFIFFFDNALLSLPLICIAIASAKLTPTGYMINDVPLEQIAATSVTFTFIISLLLFVGSFVFLFLMKISGMSPFETYKEIVNFIINCLGMGTIIGCILGFASNNPLMVLGAMSICYILMLVISLTTLTFGKKKKKKKKYTT